MKSKVIFADEKVRKAFDKLKGSKGEGKMLYEQLNRAFDDIAGNAACGIRVPGKLIPKEYVSKYRVNNLWKYNLPNAWRLIYTIKGGEVVVVSVILEWMTHKEYERRFGYD